MFDGFRHVSARNVNDALEKGLALLKMEGREEDSRNGPVIAMPGPVLTTYQRPWERVLFGEARDANPFFHLFEALWMLAGRNDVEAVAQYAARMREFSDDGEVLHGAYGFRWREWFGFDQLEFLVALLSREPNTRRAVLTMWSPQGDLVSSEGAGGFSSKDLPCNTQAYFRIRAGQLTLTVTSRSNDMVWGAYGANAVHFSLLHEYVALAVGIKQGPLYQLSNDFHIYKSVPQFAALWASKPEPNPYEHLTHAALRLLHPSETFSSFLEDCGELCDGAQSGFKTRFFAGVAGPMMFAHRLWKQGGDWAKELDGMQPCDWRLAAQQWLNRRAK